jgi:hypothetical protein
VCFDANVTETRFAAPSHQSSQVHHTILLATDRHRIT